VAGASGKDACDKCPAFLPIAKGKKGKFFYLRLTITGGFPGNDQSQISLPLISRLAIGDWALSID
jgi:hypothetical protein